MQVDELQHELEHARQPNAVGDGGGRGQEQEKAQALRDCKKQSMYKKSKQVEVYDKDAAE